MRNLTTLSRKIIANPIIRNLDNGMHQTDYLQIKEDLLNLIELKGNRFSMITGGPISYKERVIKPLSYLPNASNLQGNVS